MKAIDLGLSVKWCDCNIGASSPEKYGNYFSWGEVLPKNKYNWGTYKWYNENHFSLTKYCTKSDYGVVDKKTQFESKDDVATINLGNAWSIPTNAEWQKLIDNCTWTWTTLNGNSGYEVKGTNGNSIFLPAAGDHIDDDLYDEGDYGYYWSSSFSRYDPKDAWYMGFRLDNVGRGSCGRCYGLSIRPIYK